MMDRRNIPVYYRKLNHKMKNFLLSEKSREFFVFLFFFFIAGGFWLLQTLNGDFEDEFAVPVRLRGVPENVVITSDLPPVLYVRVKDKGTILLNYKLAKGFLPLNIDFAKVQGRDNRVCLPTARLERQLASQFNATTHMLSFKPDTLEFYYAPAVSKRVPVRMQGRLTAAKTYFLSDTLFRPDSVEVFAPAGVLDTITAAYTMPVDYEEVADTMRFPVELMRERGVKFVPSGVKMELRTDVYTEAMVEVPLEGVNFPAGKALRAFPSKVQIAFQVGKSRYKSIRPEEFHLLVSYEELLQQKDNRYAVRLRTLPPGVSHVRFNPAMVDFLIEEITPYEIY